MASCSVSNGLGSLSAICFLKYVSACARKFFSFVHSTTGGFDVERNLTETYQRSGPSSIEADATCEEALSRVVVE